MARLAAAPRASGSWLVHLVVLAAVFATIEATGVVLGAVLTTTLAGLVTSAIVLVFYMLVILKAPFVGVLLWLIFYPFAETRISLSLGVSIPDLSTTRVVALALVTFVLAEAAVGRRPMPRLTLQDVCGGLFVAGLSLSAWSSFDRLRALQMVLTNYATPLLFYFLVRTLVADQRDVERLLTAVLIIGVYSMGFAVYEHLTGQALLSDYAYSLTEYAPGIRILRSLWNSNSVFGSVFGLAIPVALYRMSGSRLRSVQLLYAALAGIFLLGLFLSFKRSAWIAVLVGLVVLAALLPRLRRILIVLLLVAGVAMAVSWDRLAASSLVEQRVISRLDTLNGRTGRWQVAIDLWLDQPWFGHGFQNFDRLSGYKAVESEYLHVLVSGGLAAFVPFALFLLLAARDSLLVYIRGPSHSGIFVSRPQLAVFLAMAPVYVVKAISEVQATPVTFLFLVLLAAVVGSQHDRLRSPPALSEPLRGREAADELVA